MSSQLAGSASSVRDSDSGRPVKDRKAWLRWFFGPVDIASLAFFRMAFGAIMVWEVCRYFGYGWIGRYYIEPAFHFTYYGFGWVQPWPGDGMYLHFLALGALALFIAAGFMYRLSMTLFFLGFTYVFLLDQALYLNHFYLISLLSFLMIFVPAHRAFSVDARLRPALRSDTVPAWVLGLIAAQVGIVYFYGGIAKLNADWLRGEPMRMWLAARSDFPLIGPLFTREWTVYLFSYGGLFVDLLAVPLLLWRRTRVPAFLVLVAFHLMNANLFSIGIFPWFMIAATLLFFPPSWPRIAARLKVGELFSPAAWSRTGRQTQPPRERWRNGLQSVPGTFSLGPGKAAVLGLLALYLAVQLLVPLRHHLYPGNVNWTEEGHRFAWHMKLRDKEALERFVAVDPANETATVIRTQDYIDLDQAADMSTRPDMILQLSHHIADDLRENGNEDVEVRALVAASLNGREPQMLIDPGADLATERRTLAPADWIEPLEGPLPDPAGKNPQERMFGPGFGKYQREIRQTVRAEFSGMEIIRPERPQQDSGRDAAGGGG